MVSLTFDDGPDERFTPLVLDALDRAGVHATFFVVAEQIGEPAGAELLRAITAAGHRVEAHCARHIAHDEQSAEALRSDLRELLDGLEATGMSRPALWRPPYGRLHRPASFEIADDAGLPLVLWTSDPRDYRDTPAPAMLQHVSEGLYEDSVILLHDSRRYASTSDSAANTVALIEPLADEVRRRGFAMGPLQPPLSHRERLSGEDEVLIPKR